MREGCICASCLCKVVVISTVVFPSRICLCCCWDVFVMNECWLHMHLLCISMSICCYACIVMVIAMHVY